jgi:hypothetical protein
MLARKLLVVAGRWELPAVGDQVSPICFDIIGIR